MKHVYQLRAKGTCGLTHHSSNEVRSSTVFTTMEKANSRIDLFRQKAIDAMLLDGERPIETTIVELTVVE